MLAGIKNILIIAALASSLAACAATKDCPMGAREGHHMCKHMCKEKMEGKQCNCCPMMKKGAADGEKGPMQCHPKKAQQ